MCLKVNNEQARIFMSRHGKQKQITLYKMLKKWDWDNTLHSPYKSAIRWDIGWKISDSRMTKLSTANYRAIHKGIHCFYKREDAIKHMRISCIGNRVVKVKVNIEDIVGIGMFRWYGSIVAKKVFLPKKEYLAAISIIEVENEGDF